MRSSTGLIKSFSWDFLGRIGKQFVGFGVGIFLARMLSPAEFGLISLSMVFISIFSFFISTGLFSALIQWQNLEEKHLSSVFYFNLAVAILLAVLLYFAAPFITFYLEASEQLIEVIRVLSLLFLISAFTQVQEAVFRRNLKFKLIAQSSLFSSIMSGAVGVWMAWAGYGVWSLVVQIILDRFVQTIYIWIMSDWRPKFLFQITAIRELWTYGFQMFLSGLLDNIVSHIDALIISKKFSATELGLYSRAKTLNGFAVRYSSESIGSVMFPAMASVQQDKEQVIQLGMKSEMMIACVSFGLLGWLYITAEHLILLLLGPQWEPAIEVYKLLCISGFAYPMGVATVSMLKATGLSRVYLKLEVYRKIVTVAGLILGFYFGFKGYLVSLVITGVINLLINVFFTGKSMGIPFGRQLINIMPYPLLTLIVSGSLTILPVSIGGHFPDILAKTVLYGLLFIGFNMLLKTPASVVVRDLLRNVLAKRKSS